MRLERALSGPICLLLLATVAACGPAEEGRAEGPGGVVQDFYERLNEAYAEAKAMYSSEARTILDDPGTTDDMFAGWARQETKQGSIDRVRVLSSELGEGSADVEVEILYGDGSSSTKNVSLIEENGEWKLNLVT